MLAAKDRGTTMAFKELFRKLKMIAADPAYLKEARLQREELETLRQSVLNEQQHFERRVAEVHNDIAKMETKLLRDLEIKSLDLRNNLNQAWNESLASNAEAHALLSLVNEQLSAADKFEEHWEELSKLLREEQNRLETYLEDSRRVNSDCEKRISAFESVYKSMLNGTKNLGKIKSQGKGKK